MKGVTNSLTTFLLLSMVLLMMQAAIQMEIGERQEYSAAASGGRAGTIAHNIGVAVQKAYSASGFNLSTAQPGLVIYSEPYPPQFQPNISGNLQALAALFNSSSQLESIRLSFQGNAGQPRFNIRPLNATLSYDSGNYTRVAPQNANYSSDLVQGYNVSIRTSCSYFGQQTMNMSNSSASKLRLRIDLLCAGLSPFTMIYDVDRYNLTQIQLTGDNSTLAIINVTAPAKLEVYKARAMTLNITISVMADPKLEVPSSYAIASGGFSEAGAVVIE